AATTSAEPKPAAPPVALPVTDLVLGIDLGTTSCVAAVMDGDAVRVVARVPSVVALGEGHEFPVSGVKCLVGRRNEELPERKQGLLIRLAPGAPDDFARVAAGGKLFTPQELLAVPLRRLKRAAEQELAVAFRRAVLAVPAHFTDAQRQAMLEAARIAGLDPTWEITDPATGKSVRQPMRLVAGPVAGALAHALDRPAPGVNAVVNDGGGFLEVAVLDVGDGVFKVEAVGGGPLPGHGPVTVERARPVLKQVLEDARCKPGNLDEVVLAGETVEAPGIRQLVR